MDIIFIEEGNDYKNSEPENFIQFRYLFFYLFIYFSFYIYLNIEYYPKTRPTMLSLHFLLHHLLHQKMNISKLVYQPKISLYKELINTLIPALPKSPALKYPYPTKVTSIQISPLMLSPSSPSRHRQTIMLAY